MSMRGPNLAIVLVIVTMAGTLGYVIHASRGVAEAGGRQKRTRPAHVRRIEKAVDIAEVALRRKPSRRDPD